MSTPDDERSFEELQTELNGIVVQLERGDVPVDEAFVLWQMGEELYGICSARLRAAELRIEDLAAGDDNGGSAG